MNVLKGYKFRIYPDEKQKKFFIETFGCVRFTYNHLLMTKQTASKESETALLTPASLKKEYPFLKKTDSLALANAQRNLERAFTNYFNGRAGYPKLKTKKNSWQSYTTNNQKHTVYFVGNQLKLPKLKSLVEVHLHREIKGQIKSVTISAKNSKEFYASVLCKEAVEPLPKTNNSVGIAFCPKNLIAVSSKQELPKMNQADLIKRLNREKRKLKVRAKAAKKRKVLLVHAKNYQKQKERVLKLGTIKLQQRKNFIDQLTITLVRQFDQLFIEAEPKFDENEQDFCFSQADWQSFLQKIRYKVQWHGKELYYVEDVAGTEPKSMRIKDLGLKKLS
ncbi:RNA-guided endonuclease TnpB family protein [Enterococcus olivae]